MSDLLSIGASGVRGYQTALSTTSENIANAGAAGYVRRTTGLAEVSSSGVKGVNGYGVAVTGVNRAADQFRSTAVRAAGADLARTETSAVWLDQVQSAMTGPDLSTRLTSFFTAATGLAADPTSTAQRQVMLENATAVAAGFTATGGALTQVQADLDATADADVASLTALAGGLAKVNEGLGRAQPGSAGAAALADQRDQILEQMSGITDVNVAFDPAGRATVKLGSDGPTLVSGNVAGTVTYARNAEGATSFAVFREGEAKTFAPQGGALAGVSDAAIRIANARADLVDLARDFAEGVNEVQAQGRDLNMQAGAAMFAIDTADPTRMSMTLTDPAQIAAASVGGGTRDAGNLTKLQSIRASDGYEKRVTGMIAGNAAALQNRKTVAEAQTAILDGAVSARDAASGVDLDNEAVDLIRFQQAYQASSRVIQVAKDTFQTLLDIR